MISYLVNLLHAIFIGYIYFVNYCSCSFGGEKIKANLTFNIIFFFFPYKIYLAKFDLLDWISQIWFTRFTKPNLIKANCLVKQNYHDLNCIKAQNIKAI